MHAKALNFEEAYNAVEAEVGIFGRSQAEAEAAAAAPVVAIGESSCCRRSYLSVLTTSNTAAEYNFSAISLLSLSDGFHR